MNKPLMILVLMFCFLSVVWADKTEATDRQEYDGESFDNRAIWANHLLWTGNATLREIAIGTMIKGATDDTIRLFTIQSASPRQALLFTDTSSSSSTPMENRWRLDTLYTAADGYYSAEIGDVDRDGDNDLIFGRSSSPYKLMWWYWTGTGWNTDDTVICEITGTGYMYDIAIGDANNDGNADDVIFTTYQSVMRAWWNGSSWDTLRLWAGDGSTCYGVAIGDYDATHAGNEIVTVTYNGLVMGITWNSAMSTWDTATIYTPAAAWHLYDVEVGDFDSNHAGEEIVVANGGTIAPIEGAIIEIYGSSGSGWSSRPLYTPTGSEYPRELAIGDCLDENAGDEIVYASSTSPYEARVVYGSGSSWDNQAVFTPGGTSYGVDVGDVDQYRVDNDEIAVTGSYDVYEAEQYWPTNDLAVTTGAPHSYPFVISDPESLWARVMNNGTATQNNFQVYLYINGAAYDSVTVATLAGGDSVDVDFNFVPGAQGGINFTIFHSLTPDEIAYNDTLGTIDPVAGFPDRFHDWVFETGTYKAEGFEYLMSFPPSGWVVINADSGNYWWNWYTSSTNPELMNSGIIFASCHYETPSTLRNDDWLITDMVSPSASYADSFGFYYRTYSASAAESLEVWVMSGQTVDDTVAMIWAINIANQTYAPVKLPLDDYDGQNIYLAFHYVSLYEWYIDVDDVYWTANQDAVGPDISLIEMPENTYLAGPYTVRAVITDPSGILTDSLFYIIDDAATAIPNTSVAGDTFTYEIPTQIAGTCIDYYVMAADMIPNIGYSAQERFWVLSPMAPTDLTAAPQVDSTVRLDWLPPGEELSYYGTIAYFWQGWTPGSMIATQYTPQHTPCKLEAFSMMFYINIGDTVEVHVWDDNGSGNPGDDLWVDTIIVSQVYPNFEVFDVSAEDIVVSGDFHVGLVWLTLDAPRNMSDDGALTTRSKLNPGGSGWIPAGYDWVMSVVVSYVAPPPEVVTVKAAKSDKFMVAESHGKRATLQPEINLPNYIRKHEVGRTFVLESKLLERILGIANFEVERSEVQGGPYTSLGTTSASYLVDNTVITETQYYYVVKANYTTPDTVSYYSNEVTIGVDFTPPSYANTTYDSLVAGPWVVSTELTDWTGLAYDSLGYRADGGAFAYVTNDSVSGVNYYYTIPNYPSYTLIEFYLFSQDSSFWQNAGLDPAAGYYSFTVTQVQEYKQALIPDRVFLSQNRPNPFARLTQVEYGVPRSMEVDIAIYNTAGQRVSTLVSGVKAPGFYKINWSGMDDLGRRLAEGVYFVRMTTDELTDTKKVIFIK